MTRPALPYAKDVASIAKAMRAEGYSSFSITTPEGLVISAGMIEEKASGPDAKLAAFRERREADGPS